PALAEDVRGRWRLAMRARVRELAPAAPFDPAAAAHTWRIAATDYGASAIVLPALPVLRAASPASRLAVVEMAPARIARQAEQGAIDLALHTSEGSPANLRRRALFTERYVLAGRAGHPRLKERPTLAQFCTLDQVSASPAGGGFHGATDEVLAMHGAQRRVVLSVPHFLFLRSVLESTDLVAMLPQRLVRDQDALQVVDAPVEVPGFEMSMLWHERSHRDPAH